MNTKTKRADKLSATLYITAVGVIVVGVIVGFVLFLVGQGTASVIVSIVAVGVGVLFLAAGFVTAQIADRHRHFGR
ncbi:hypothetical protein DVJ78_18060 (plasmid) [Humibacter sp. BT305]|uniref:Uncharacterized protein n=1 Tax=Cnuibacter physcomitrellae TaxID=1619308 RepID=A0A1X9LRH2_9MICO|nr:hypothetical protein [Cnuibacter physcomitrellae]ARJ07794.1 hypothetical protein B5808_20605 [Cnuibacter physcomitrellae]AXH37482.1 hypothetical protein DVJ78_18060 [Humibacter sp. BT305]GGI42932.1 hypothetical protein GCM10010988_41510 [Cnuibacter physcomitrellae]